VLAVAVRDGASSAFLHGLSVGCLVAAGVAVLGAAATALFLPAQPETSEQSVEGAQDRTRTSPSTLAVDAA